MTNIQTIQDILKSNRYKQWTTREVLEKAKEENPSIHKETICVLLNKLVKKNKVAKVRETECYYTWKEL
jgi:predicted transcriptional regulator